MELGDVQASQAGLPFEEMRGDSDVVAYALGGIEAVESRMSESGSCSSVWAYWNEGPVLLHRVLALIAEVVRPAQMPGAPPLAFGENPLPALREVARQIDGSGYKLLGIDDGSDYYLVALVRSDFDSSKAEKEWESAQAERELQETVRLTALAEVHRPEGDGTGI